MEICGLCKGSGNLLSFKAGKPRYWDCPCCGRAGAEVMLGPATLRTHARKVYHDPEGILNVPVRKLKEQQQLDAFNALWKERIHDNT